MSEAARANGPLAGAWVLKDGVVLASVEVLTTRKARRKGLLGRTGVEGAVVLPKTRWVHTIGMQFAIDVAHVTGDGVIVHVATMPRHRLGRPVRAARFVLEAEAGAFARWGLAVGDRIEVVP